MTPTSEMVAMAEQIAHEIAEEASAEDATDTLTVRDEFAMAFLSGVAGTLGSAKVIYFSDIARDAYAAADAMMEARKK